MTFTGKKTLADSKNSGPVGQERGGLVSLLRPLLMGALIALASSCLTLSAWLSLQAEYERDIFEQIARQALHEATSDEEKAMVLLHAAHRNVAGRTRVFSGTASVNVVDTLFRSPMNDLIDGRGACGSYTTVLAALLKVSDFDFRLLRLNCGERKGCHILLEAKIGKRWVAMDAMYDLVFHTPEGELAAMADIRGKWKHYRAQVPGDFPANYFTFEAYDYTNWNKIPYLMPMLKSFLHIVIGERVESLSLRSHVLDKKRIFSCFLLVTGLMAMPAACLIGRSARN